MSKTYSAGIVTAYGAAKRAGYTGTYEDFCRQQAGYAESAATVEQAKNTAVSAANTATTKAGEAATAATAAQTAKTQTEAAASQALTDISIARSGAISAVQTEGQTQTANARAQALAAAQSATTASTKASEASASATSAGQSATNASASATSADQSARDAHDVLDSIPADYSALSANVSQLKADLDNVGDEVKSGTESIFTDLSLWHNGYINSSGTLVSTVKSLSPSSTPIKLDNGKTVCINTGSLVCGFGILRYNEDTQTYTRTQNTEGLSGDFSIVSDSDNYYYALTFKFDPQVTISPSDFDGRIYQVLDWRLQVDNCISQVDALPNANGLVYAYSDLSAWNRGYFNSRGILVSASIIITPISEPFKMLSGDVLVVNPGNLVLAVATYNYSNGGYTRQSSTEYTEITTITFDTETYVSFQFSKNPSGSVTPSEFTGYIKAQTVWLNKIHTNTARIVALENASASGNYLSGKKLVACGDSITAAVNPSGGNFDSYAKLTAMRNGMEFEVNAVSGSTMTNVTGKSPFCVDRYQNIPSDFDYLTIWFGYNDGAYAQVGTVEDTEDTTFYGAYKKVLDYIVAQYPTKKIGIVVPYMSNSAFQEAVRNISEMYGIPCLDLPNGNQCSCVWGDANSAQTARKSALTYDNTHPNQEGHSFISTMYEAFLRRL